MKFSRVFLITFALAILGCGPDNSTAQIATNHPVEEMLAIIKSSQDSLSAIQSYRHEEKAVHIEEWEAKMSEHFFSNKNSSELRQTYTKGINQLLNHVISSRVTRQTSSLTLQMRKNLISAYENDLGAEEFQLLLAQLNFQELLNGGSRQNYIDSTEDIWRANPDKEDIARTLLVSLTVDYHLPGHSNEIIRYFGTLDAIQKNFDANPVITELLARTYNKAPVEGEAFETVLDKLQNLASANPNSKIIQDCNFFTRATRLRSLSAEDAHIWLQDLESFRQEYSDNYAMSERLISHLSYMNLMTTEHDLSKTASMVAQNILGEFPNDAKIRLAYNKMFGTDSASKETGSKSIRLRSRNNSSDQPHYCH